MYSRDELEKMYKQFIEEEIMNKHDWTSWNSVTFVKPKSVQGALKSYKRCIKHLNVPEYSYFDNYVHTFVVVEYNASCPGVHIHSFLDKIRTEDWNRLEREFFKNLGNTKIKAMHEGIPGYLANKFAYGKIADFELCKINSRVRTKNTFKGE